MIDWPAIHREALDIFVRYLQIDTSNPPGNEKPAARFLGALCESEGIAVEYIETAPNREVLVARLDGDGSKRPIMLCNHTDVVPVEAEYWTMPAFEGLVTDGRIYGRGAVDMKGCGVMQLIAFALLKRQGVPLKRDVVFCAVPDEEAGSDWGMVWLCEHRPDVVDVEFELSEGGGGTTRFGREETKLFSIATNEKDICWLKLTSVGRPGHGSVPHADNSAVYLVQALNRLVEWERPLTFTPDTEAYLERLAEAGLMPRDRAEVEERIRQSPEMQAMFVNTLNLTMLNAGIKANVIPAKSEAVIDCRLLPGQAKDDWIRQVRERIADERIEVELYSPDQGEPERVPWDTELFRAINDVVKEAMEDAVVVPGMTIGGTDNRSLRAMGIPAYGFIPCLLSPEERRGFHGNDEFMTVENFQMGCELMYEIVRRMVV
ncbi:MAG: M20/M25/M40 family metallo-hydrolase [Dehalococcoidia bacterium]|nr:M20/M25/M40 family metallo-hydrolase [Dehalococcoidia bacterium]